MVPTPSAVYRELMQSAGRRAHCMFTPKAVAKGSRPLPCLRDPTCPRFLTHLYVLIHPPSPIAGAMDQRMAWACTGLAGRRRQPEPSQRPAPPSTPPSPPSSRGKGKGRGPGKGEGKGSDKGSEKGKGRAKAEPRVKTRALPQAEGPHNPEFTEFDKVEEGTGC